MNEREPVSDDVVAVLRRPDGTMQVISDELAMASALAGRTPRQLEILLRLILAKLINP